MTNQDDIRVFRIHLTETDTKILCDLLQWSYERHEYLGLDNSEKILNVLEQFQSQR